MASENKSKVSILTNGTVSYTHLVGRELETASDVRPAKTAGMLILISLACTAAAAVVTVGVMRLLRRRNRKTRKH